MSPEIGADTTGWVTGACMCDRVRFEVRRPVPDFYRCHCSLCRRQGGAAGNTSTLVPVNAFRWSSSDASITRWQKPTGFNSHFCSACGCPVPNPLGDGTLMWVPAGLLDDADGARIVGELAYASRASWDDASTSGTEVFDEVPDLDILVALLWRRVRAASLPGH